MSTVSKFPLLTEVHQGFEDIAEARCSQVELGRGLLPVLVEPAISKHLLVARHNEY